MRTPLPRPYLITLLALVIIVQLACSNALPYVTEATALPTPTYTSAPTAVPETLTALRVPSLYIINVDQRIDVPPDLMEQLFIYYGSAGGAAPSNEKPPRGPFWVSLYEGSTEPAVPGVFHWSVCNVTKKPKPDVLLTLPTGEKIELSIGIPTEEWIDPFGFLNCVNADYEIKRGTLFGEYSIEFHQGDNSLVDSVNLEMPLQPVQAKYLENIWFSGFQPGEQVTISIYYLEEVDYLSQTGLIELLPEIPFLEEAPNKNFSGEVIFFLSSILVTADEYGSFQIKPVSEKLPLEGKLIIIARGDVSGATGNEYLSEVTGTCGDSLPTRLRIGDNAIITNYKEQISSRNEKHEDVILKTGTMVKVVFGPLCDQYNWTWWVDTDHEVNLRVFESDENGYFLEPVTK